MSTSRRNFLIGLGAGLILPRKFEQVAKHVIQTKEPLLQVLSRPLHTLYARDWGGNGAHSLHLDFVEEDMPDFSKLSWKRYFELFYPDAEGFDGDLGAVVDPIFAENHWMMNHTSNAKAFKLLEPLKSGLGLDARYSADKGWVDFTDGTNLMADYRGVDVDLLGMSLLQEQLNALNTGISIEYW